MLRLINTKIFWENLFSFYWVVCFCVGVVLIWNVRGQMFSTCWSEVTILATLCFLDSFLQQHIEGMFCSSWALHGFYSGVLFMEYNARKSFSMNTIKTHSFFLLFVLILSYFVFPSCGVTEAQASSGCSGGMEGCEKKNPCLPVLSALCPLPPAFPSCLPSLSFAFLRWLTHLNGCCFVFPSKLTLVNHLEFEWYDTSEFLK